jgi:hypothetical protein
VVERATAGRVGRKTALGSRALELREERVQTNWVDDYLFRQAGTMGRIIKAAIEMQGKFFTRE